ncbi:hypothetical protein V6N13_114655 [Hibiscus sabdariffa]|uniref:RRM domain-containing protein n=1 Tax=Hibiscus sabdariffa TaxID=183260 RepID=A0ABR2U2R2_9ROSI
MGDPYYRYPPPAGVDRGSIPRPSFPGYFSAEAPLLPSHYANMQAAPSNVQKIDISQMQPGMYGVNNISSSGAYPDTNIGGLSAGATARAYPSSLGDPSLGAQRWNAPVGNSSGAGVHPDPNFGGVSAGPSIREVPNLVGHRWDAPGSSSAGVHPEPSLGAVSAAASICGYSSPLDIPSFAGQRQDVPVGINSTSRLHPEPSPGAVSAGASIKGYPSPRKDSPLVDQRKDGPLGTNPSNTDALDGKTASVRNGDCHTDAAGESNILFVDCLPTDCTRREVGHLFRPFTGYKDIKVIHKEPRRSGDRAMVLCFVEFDDSKFATIAMRALQGYKFDDKKPDSLALQIQFAHFPFQLQTDRKEHLQTD